ncbi:calcium/proton exchanger [Aquibacillus sp. 3ASR75-11]|uniref:Ca(2+)/H(+) antiporter n=1 Tax=Terrihalobacillus insolitus TaxID=2950438 RepID=A0A9X3WXN5_9BACI|nr:calcium/proton exchanger [Terrihalobacillus insolitus]MDC3413134.1 calcium/proton exchanger [Terrihalobacillus insolitus]MDC3425194.1 calcium/proton exchanger [Terrihalobacillus insolitus]
MYNKIMSTLVFVGVPVSVIGSLMSWSQILMFIFYCLTIVALAAYMGRATESLAIISGPAVGGLLNATFGNAVEMIIAIFALRAGLREVVLASLTGSVIGNLLLVAGLSFLVGGVRFKRQKYNVYDARHNSALLMFAVIVAFIFPIAFSYRLSEDDAMFLSTSVAIIMILLYIAALFFKLVTHRGVYPSVEEGEQNEKPEWSKGKAMIVLFLATIAVAYISESLVQTFETVGETFGWSEIFIGVIIVAIVGNAAEHGAAIIMAYKNRMSVAVEIAVGSTLQIAMFVAPLLVLISYLFEESMPLIFSMPELVSMVLGVLLTIQVTNDGDTNWFEGATLLATYAIMVVGFYLL